MSARPPSAQDGSRSRKMVLDLLLEKRAQPTRDFAAAADRAELDGRDRALARAMLSGVIRRRRTVDAIFRPYAKRKNLGKVVLWTLRLAVYQRFFMQGVPVYAACNATLEAAKMRLGRALGFANAVLRAVEKGSRELEGQDNPAPHASVLVEEGRAWKFDQALFPEPGRDPAAYWSVALSYPELLARRWVKAAGVDLAVARMRAQNTTPPLVLRVNQLRSERGTVQAELAGFGLESRPLDGPQALLITQPTGDVALLPGFAAGHWSVQDPSAQAAVALAAPQAGEQVLDYCAAPGGKSFAAYEATGGKARITACDVNPERLDSMRRDARRLGHQIELRGIQGGEAPQPAAGEWDLVILDVPCSNTGVLGRRPEARWKFRVEELAECMEVQAAIAGRVLPQLLGPRTRLLWSTCSLEPEENEQAVERLLAAGRLRLVEARRFEPDAERAGGFAALLAPRA